MKVTVDGQEIELIPGMTVRHAILARYGRVTAETAVYDRWGNQLGLDGEPEDSALLRTVPVKESSYRSDG